MHYEPIDAKLFMDHRARLAAQMAPRSLAVVNANDLLPSNSDATMTYHPNSDLFYLTGIEQQESILVIFPDASNDKQREILFLQENNELTATWDGARLSKDEAKAISGVQTIYWLKDFEGVFRGLMCEAESVYLNLNEHYRARPIFEDRSVRFVRQCQHNYPLHHYRRLAPLLHELRQCKSPAEVDLIRKACAVTEAGFRRVLGFIRPGVAEYEIEAEFIHEFKRRGCDFAYPPIIGTGRNGCVLHYLKNTDICKDGDLVLMDVAATYAQYDSDLTRTVPVSGRFTPRQRMVYQAVLNILRNAMKLLKPGVVHKDYEKQVGHLAEQEMVRIGLLDADAVRNQNPDTPLYRKYLMHGVSHFVGIDTHDVGNLREPMKPGMVFTVEPGIYLPDEGFGVRLENDVVITETGCEDLMAGIPIEPDEIEALMARARG